MEIPTRTYSDGLEVPQMQSYIREVLRQERISPAMEIPTRRVLCLAQGPDTSGDGDQGQGLQRFPTSDISPCLRVVSTDQRPSEFSHKSRLAAPQGRAKESKQRPNPELRLRWT